MDFRALAKQATTISDIFTNRTKVNKADGTYHIYDFDLVTASAEPYAVCAISDKEFINGGYVLTKIFVNIVSSFDGDVAIAREEFRKSGGFDVRLFRERTKNGHDLVKVEVL